MTCDVKRRASAERALAIVSRRQALRGVGAVALASTVLGACGEDDAKDADQVRALQVDSDREQTTPDAGVLDLPGDASALSCVVTPAQTEGPFFIDAKMNRSNMLEGETDLNTLNGLPLSLRLAVYTVAGERCAPLSGAHVDIWHADTNGLYSAVAPTFFQRADTATKRFCRAYQVTDDRGMVAFRTIYPGWYGTRAIHIHFKIRKYAPAGDKTYEFTSQLYFDEKINDLVMARDVYATRGARRIRNEIDQVFNGTGPGAGPDNVGPKPGTTPPGAHTTVALSSDGAGYSGIFTIGLKLT